MGKRSIARLALAVGLGAGLAKCGPEIPRYLRGAYTDTSGESSGKASGKDYLDGERKVGIEKATALFEDPIENKYQARANGQKGRQRFNTFTNPDEVYKDFILNHSMSFPYIEGKSLLRTREKLAMLAKASGGWQLPDPSKGIGFDRLDWQVKKEDLINTSFENIVADLGFIGEVRRGDFIFEGFQYTVEPYSFIIKDRKEKSGSYVDTLGGRVYKSDLTKGRVYRDGLTELVLWAASFQVNADGLSERFQVNFEERGGIIPSMDRSPQAAGCLDERQMKRIIGGLIPDDSTKEKALLSRFVLPRLGTAGRKVEVVLDNIYADYRQGNKGGRDLGFKTTLDREE